MLGTPKGDPMSDDNPRYRMVRFAEVPGTPCPCGVARRAFHDFPGLPATVHVTEIAHEAKLHFHRLLTETYYFLECDPGSRMQLDDDVVDVAAGTCIVIPPGVRHRAIGRMKVLLFVTPKFDPADEWIVEDAPGGGAGSVPGGGPAVHGA